LDSNGLDIKISPMAMATSVTPSNQHSALGIQQPRDLAIGETGKAALVGRG
jgi:hypothetical protein